jgi:hypothetical protein
MSDRSEVKSSLLTSLRMPQEWHVYKEGERRQRNGHRRGLLVFSKKGLTFFWPAADRTGSVIPWFVSREVTSTCASYLVLSQLLKYEGKHLSDNRTIR